MKRDTEPSGDAIANNSSKPINDSKAQTLTTWTHCDAFSDFDSIEQASIYYTRLERRYDAMRLQCIQLENGSFPIEHPQATAVQTITSHIDGDRSWKTLKSFEDFDTLEEAASWFAQLEEGHKSLLRKAKRRKRKIREMRDQSIKEILEIMVTESKKASHRAHCSSLVHQVGMKPIDSSWK